MNTPNKTLKRKSRKTQGNSGLSASSTILPLPPPFPVDTCAAFPYIGPVDNIIIEKKKSQIAEQIAAAKNRVAVLEGQYNLLLELETGDTKDRVTMAAEAVKGMEALGEFSKKQLNQWVREANSGLKYNIKSLDRIISIAISDGRVRLLKENVGNKLPAIYQWAK
jgi:hypothetical protein